MTSKPKTTLLAAGFVGMLLLAGCVPVPPQPTSTTTAPTVEPEPVDPQLQQYYAQQLDWEDCGAGRECAIATAPIDWQNPGSGDIELAMVRIPASGAKIGSLFTNPGGPGASGYSFVYDYGDFIFGAEVMQQFDIVSWDPRGVGRSTPVRCFANDADKNFFLFEAEVDTEFGEPGYIDELDALYAELAADCERLTGDLLGHVDTVSTAHDLDLMRALVGDRQLHYIGFSYGAYLGTVYADEFADKVGRVVVDGPVNPAIGIVDLVIEQNIGFEEGYQQFLANCLQASGCPFRGSIENATQQTVDLLKRLEASPLRASDGRQLWGSSFTLSIAAALYTERDWPVLRSAISDVLQGDADLAYALIDYYHGRSDDGSFDDNSYEANLAINCLDYPVSRDLGRWEADVRRIAETSPVFGAIGGYPELFCDVWPYQSNIERESLTAAGSAPIVVVGSTFDTATPYQWAVEVANALENGVLLTRDGQGHTSYGQGNRCIDGAIDTYLLTGVVPAEGTVC